MSSLTPFRPRQHGFHFSNNFITWSFGPFTGKALCGGMVYAALDYYLCGMEIPTDTNVPEEGTTLHQYIYDRQVQAHKNTIPTFFGEYETDLKVRATESMDTFNRLDSMLNAGILTPLCLTQIWKGHHVLALGTTSGEQPNVVVYDPNFPDKFSFLTREGQNVGSAPAWTHSVSRERWVGLFIDDGYKRNTPNLIYGETNWRWCVKCQGLFWNGSDGGKCPAGGGTHSAGGIKNYVLPNQDGSGQDGWRWCKQCQGMYFGGHLTLGACPARGATGHDPTNSTVYSIPLNSGVGEPGWRWCKKCEGMFWAGNMGNGSCPASGTHDPSESGQYSLMSVKV